MTGIGALLLVIGLASDAGWVTVIGSWILVVGALVLLFYVILWLIKVGSDTVRE